MKYYHMTPETRLPKVLKEGIKPSIGRGLGLSVPSEETKGKVFLGRDIEECREQVELFPTTPRYENWSIVEVDIPSSWILEEDESGYLYTRQRIPPSCISGVVSSDSLRHKAIADVVISGAGDIPPELGYEELSRKARGIKQIIDRWRRNRGD